MTSEGERLYFDLGLRVEVRHCLGVFNSGVFKSIFFPRGNKLFLNMIFRKYQRGERGADHE
jgi:hypothetical protein